jgi:hypothetical protein
MSSAAIIHCQSTEVRGRRPTVVGGFLFKPYSSSTAEFRKFYLERLGSWWALRIKAFLQIRLPKTEFMASYLSVKPAAGIIDRAEGASVCTILKKKSDTVSRKEPRFV